MDDPSKKRRRLRIGPWLTVAVVCAVVVATVWIGATVRGYARRHHVRQEIEARGAVVSTEPAGRGGLGRLLPEAWTEEAVCVYWGVETVSDEDLALLEELRSVRLLDLEGAAITDEGLAHMSHLRELRQLMLNRTPVSDAGMEHLAGLSELRGLSLDHTRVGDAGLEHLAGLTKLRELYLRGTKVTDTGVQQLRVALPSAEITR
jgi:hypothetical protein